MRPTGKNEGHRGFGTDGPHRQKRGTPSAVLLSIRDYLKLAVPEPEVLRAIGEESRSKGTDKLTSRQIDQVIKAARGQKRKRG